MSSSVLDRLSRGAFDWGALVQPQVMAEVFLPAAVLDDRCDRRSLLSRRLSFYIETLNIAIDSINKLFSAELNYFDAIVGDTRCEVRALQLLDLVNRLSGDLSLRLALLRDLAGLRSLIVDLERVLVEGDHRPCTMREVISEGNLMMSMAEASVFAFLSFALAAVKRRDADNIHRTDATGLARLYAGLSGKMSRRLVRHYQVCLSRSSVGYLVSLAGKDVVAAVRSDVDGRLAIPTLQGFLHLLGALTEDRRMVVVRLNIVMGGEAISQALLCFRGDGAEGFDFLGGLGDLRLDGATPVYVIEACREVCDMGQMGAGVEEVKSLDLRGAILASASHKPHYPVGCVPKGASASLNLWREELRGIGGYSLDDPSVFCITHVFTLSVGELLAGEVPITLMRRDLVAA